MLPVYSITEAAERLDIPASTVKWYADRFASYISPSKGKGKKRFTPEDLATLQKIHELSQDHTTEEVEAMLEVSGDSITMYRSDAVTTALDVLTSRMQAAMEETIKKQLSESSETAADLAISKLLDSIGTNTELELWIDQQFKKADVKSLTEAKILARKIQKAIIKRWKDSHS